MRYFFDLAGRHGKTVDAHGIAFADFEQARLEAKRILTRAAGEELDDNLAMSIRLRDQNNVPVYELSLKTEGRRLDTGR